MYQVLFRIPIKTAWTPDGVPIYGFGAMLCVALFVCTWLAGRRAEKEGIRKEHIQDLALWLLVGGIVGARLTFLVFEKVPFSEFLQIWNGGLVFYGCVPGALIAYWLGYRFSLRKHGISTWQLTDILAPSVALGLCLGRIGCLLNGCCYGEVACPQCPTLPFPPAIRFPLSGPARFDLVHKGYQTAAGFTIAQGDPVTVGAVEPNSAAEKSGLRSGDMIVEADGREIKSYQDLSGYLADPGIWPRGKCRLQLKVLHPGDNEPVQLAAFAPWTIGLQPTQVYESISMFLLFLLLTAYLPFRRHYGEVMALLMFCYGIHRSLNETLRSDPRPNGLEMYTSIFLIVTGLVLWIGLKWLPARTVQTANSAA